MLALQSITSKAVDDRIYLSEDPPYIPEQGFLVHKVPSHPMPWQPAAHAKGLILK